MASNFFLLRVTNPTPSAEAVPTGASVLWGAKAESAEDALRLVAQMALQGRQVELVTDHYLRADIERIMNLPLGDARPV